MYNGRPRNILTKTIQDNCSSFIPKSPIQKHKYLLSQTFTIISDVCTSIKQSVELRNKGSTSV